MNKTDKKVAQWQQKQLKREYKLFAGEMKATNDSQGIVEGYLNAIGNIDYGLDRTLSGAFKRTLNNAYERKKAVGDDFLWPYLWNHSYDLVPPGGIFDASEDKNGLYIKAQLNLEYDLARNMYTSFKMGTLKKQSMGYIAHQWEYIKEDGQMVRNLIEVEVLEGSGVVFPMNDLADITGVKRSQSGLYVPRPYWPGYQFEEEEKGTSRKQATSGDTASADAMTAMASMADQLEPLSGQEFDVAFMQMMIPHHQAAIAMAELVPDRTEQDDLAELAESIIKAQTDEIDEMTDWLASWYDEKPMVMKKVHKKMEKKDFGDEYRTRRISDWQSSFWSWFSALQASIMDAFDQGDDPMGDVQANLNGVDNSPGAIQELLNLIQEGIDLDVSNYLDGLEQLHGSGYYDYMSYRNPALAQKAGAAFSQGNTDVIHLHAANLRGMADGLLGALQGLGAPSSSYLEQGTTGDEQGNPKSRRFARALAQKAGAEFSEDNLRMLGDHATGLHGVASTIHQMAEDLAQNTGAQTYVDVNGNADNAKETDTNKSASRPQGARGQQHSPTRGTADIDNQADMDSLLASLQRLGSIL